MELLFLGTSSGTPTKHRNVSSLTLMESKGKGWFMIDVGEGTQHQLQHTKLSFKNLKGIFITHIHGDHCYGLPGLLASAGMSGRKEPLNIIAPQGVKKWFTILKETTQLFLPFEIKFIDVENMTKTTFGEYEVTTIEMSHRVPSYAYIFKSIITDVILNNDKLKSLGIKPGPIWGKLKNGEDVEYNNTTLLSKDFIEISTETKTTVVCGDNDNPKLLESISDECDILVHESTYTKDVAEKIGRDVGHCDAALIATYAENFSIPNLILTHFSPRYDSNSIHLIENEASNLYSGNLFIANDFAKYKLDKNKKLVCE